jgi:hypothetical protein
MRITRHSLILLLAFTGCQVAPSPKGNTETTQTVQEVLQAMFTPSPMTSRTVTTNDVVGVWSFVENLGRTTVFMTFMPSGVFTQQVVTVTDTNTQVGKWTLDGPHLDLTDFLARIDQDWKPYPMHWYFIDGDKRDDKRLVIYGGAFPRSDPYQHLRYLRATP